MSPAFATVNNYESYTGYKAIAATLSSLHLLTRPSSPLPPPTKSILGSVLIS